MRVTLPALVLAALVLPACEDGGASASASQVTNLARAAERVLGGGRLRLVAVPEDAGDLDGDGDREDLVLQVLDLELGTLHDTRVALALEPRSTLPEAPPFAASDTQVACLVSERRTGRDLDGDGRLAEALTAVHDGRTGALVCLPFAHRALRLSGDVAAFVVEEGELDALYVLDARDGSLVVPTHELARLIEVRDGLVAFTLAELGARDLNQDGDRADAAVLHVYDVGARRLVNTGWNAKDGWAELAGGFVGFDVDEAEQGLDLDGDGALDDIVFVAVDPRSGLARLPGFADARFLDAAERAAGGGDGQRFLLAVSEAHGDRNGDGDALDWIAVVYDARTDERLGPELASAGRPYASGPWLGLSVSEYGEGLDLDGDGALGSNVPHVFDARTGELRNLGFAGAWLAGLDGHLLGLAAVAGAPGRQELFRWSAADGVVRFAGLDPQATDGVAGDAALFHQLEGLASGDLNRDRDLLDQVLVVYDGRADAARTLGLAVRGEARLDAAGRSAVLVDEAEQGRDLDGDGALRSLVLHALDLRR